MPSDHGSWVFLLSPYLIGLFAADPFLPESIVLLSGLFSAFMLRQPAAILVKALSKRRSKQVLPSAIFWAAFYSLIGALSLLNLICLGYGFLLWLVIPGAVVFLWHLWLVSRRTERHRMGVDIIASGVLALAAPAAYWVNLGGISETGWILWLLAWLQSAASIVYAFLRLQQRRMDACPTKQDQFQMGKRALLYSAFNFLFALVLSLIIDPRRLIWLPYMLQMAETYWGVFHPAVGLPPTKIGLRQLVVSSLFTILFIAVWKIPLPGF